MSVKKEASPLKSVPMITPGQLRFLDSLLIDCGFSDRIPRNSYITRVCEREIQFLAQLTKEEASKLIDDLKTQTEWKRPKFRSRDEDEEDDWYGSRR